MPKPIAFLLFIVFCFFPCPSSADYYRYADEKGVVHITNDIENVPKKYRKKMIVRKEEDLREPSTEMPPPPAARNTVESSPEPDQTSEPQPQPPSALVVEKNPLFGNRYVVYGAGLILYGAGIFVVTFVLKKFIDHRRASRLAFFLFLGGLMVFLYRLYVVEMRDRFFKAKDEIKQLQKAFEEKEYKNQQEIENMLRPMEGISEVGKDNQLQTDAQ